MLEVTDRISVLKNSRKVATLETPQATKHQLIELMIGSDAKLLQQTYEQGLGAQERAGQGVGEVVLAVRGLTQRGVFDDVSVDLRAGEIVGLFGFMGAGQNQFARCLFGAEAAHTGSLALDGKPLRLKDTSAARDAGIAYVPENRRNALMLTQEIYKNITLAHLGTLIRGLLNQRTELAVAGRLSTDVGVRPAERPLMPVGALSGGNQQKVVLAKWLTRQPRVLLLNEPTRGMDVGAKDEVMSVVQGLGAKGVATLLITTEPETIVAYAHRALVMSKGRITAELSGASLTKDQLMKNA